MLLTFVEKCSLIHCINNVNRGCVLSGVKLNYLDPDTLFVHSINSSSECQIRQALKLKKTQDLILGK